MQRDMRAVMVDARECAHEFGCEALPLMARSAHGGSWDCTIDLQGHDRKADGHDAQAVASLMRAKGWEAWSHPTDGVVMVSGVCS